MSSAGRQPSVSLELLSRFAHTILALPLASPSLCPLLSPSYRVTVWGSERNECLPHPSPLPSSDAIADDSVRFQYVKKKGYVRLRTNKGDVNLELHCDKVRN